MDWSLGRHYYLCIASQRIEHSEWMNKYFSHLPVIDRKFLRFQSINIGWLQNQNERPAAIFIAELNITGKCLECYPKRKKTISEILDTVRCFFTSFAAIRNSFGWWSNILGNNFNWDCAATNRLKVNEICQHDADVPHRILPSNKLLFVCLLLRISPILRSQLFYRLSVVWCKNTVYKKYRSCDVHRKLNSNQQSQAILSVSISGKKIHNIVN